MNQTIPATSTDTRDASPARRAVYRVAVRTAAVAAVFTLVVCAMLLWEYGHRLKEDPLELRAFRELKIQLIEQPKDEQLKEQIREWDIVWRERYFRQQKFAAMGSWLLVGGVVVFLISAKSAATLHKRLPNPGPQTVPQDRETKVARAARWSVAGLAVVLTGSAVALSLSIRTELPRDAKQLAALLKPQPVAEPKPVPEPGFLSDEETRRMWTRFRGPGGAGISAYTNVPDLWDGGSGKNILWKTAVPLPGNNSPVVCSGRVFLSGATETERQVYCFDADTGKLLWRKDVPSTPQSRRTPLEVLDQTGYAAPGTTTDGRRVFAIFANGDLAAFDFEGNPTWSRSFGIPENAYGHSSSLIMYRDWLLVQFDQGSSGKDAKSRLYALKNTTGDTVWEVRREVPNSWASPILIQHEGRDQVITCADPWVIAYDPSDGSEIWRAKVLRDDVGPSPVYANGLVHVGNEYCEWSVIRPDGEGDVTDSHVVWTAMDGLPDCCSPLVTDQYVFLVPPSAMLACLDVTNGELLWEKEFEDDFFTSSPSLVGDRVYLISNEGRMWIFRPTREECQVVGQAELGEGCVTSPAFQDGRIYIRGEQHLFCIAAQ
jgi:outer membrane protein assembly factor BamB